MKLSLSVSSHAERDAINRAFEDPILRAAMTVAGVLLDIEPADRARVLEFARFTLSTNGSAPTPGENRLHDGSAGD
jgi:hypothetical protein